MRTWKYFFIIKDLYVSVVIIHGISHFHALRHLL